MEIISTKPHCPGSTVRLIESILPTDLGYVNLNYVYDSQTQKEGLEAYYHKGQSLSFYTSRFWPIEQVPAKYKKVFEELRAFKDKCPDGHKILVGKF